VCSEGVETEMGEGVWSVEGLGFRELTGSVGTDYYSCFRCCLFPFLNFAVIRKRRLSLDSANA
jgi:hypothetical protein